MNNISHVARYIYIYISPADSFHNRRINVRERLRIIIRYSVAINSANVIADRRTHLPWLLSRSVVDTLYWTETVTTSRLNVVDDVDEVCVLMWPVVYSRGVVYVELVSVTGQREKIV